MTSATPDTPFACTYTPGFPAILHELNASLAISTYQAGKVVLLSPGPDGQLIQLPRTFVKAMGIAVKADRLAVATRDEVLLLVNSPELAHHYPPAPRTYDALYMPRAAYFTGPLDIHDLEWGTDGLYAVNTLFSCLCRIDEKYSFTPVWRPPFVDALAAEDRCHLNGMAMRDGQPAFATAFNRGNSPFSWRREIMTGGIVMEVPGGRVLAEGLAMPHSPRWYDDGLYLLLSAKGELLRLQPESGEYEVLFRYEGFLRGMDRLGDYLFIGISRPRRESATFSQLPAEYQSKHAGVLAVHLPSRQLAGQLLYHQSVEEIYDVRLLANQRRPTMLNTLKGEHRLGLSTPEKTYWAGTEQFSSTHKP